MSEVTRDWMDWVKVIGVIIVVVIALISAVFGVFATRAEMKAEFKAIHAKLDQAAKERAELRTDIKQLNQNYSDIWNY